MFYIIVHFSLITEAPKVSLDALFGAKEVKVRAGEPLKLALGISGSPTPTVTWTKNGKPVERVNSQYFQFSEHFI